MRADAREVADEGRGDDDERHRRDVPGVDEGEPAEQDRRRDEQRAGAASQNVMSSGSGLRNSDSASADDEQHERQRHHVRVQVAEQEAEHRELGDDAEVGVVQRVDARWRRRTGRSRDGYQACCAARSR